ncbi:MAG TPA: GPW/gp25 family protein [Cellvibrio sp.]|nr:GPW/gp25 family protein [Cellvibrio sp.]
MTIPVPQVMSWPLEGVDAQGRLGYASDDLSVREVIRNILLTRPGERLMRPQFGAGLLDFIHQPNNETTRTLMANVIKKAIAQWETRVIVDTVEVQPDSASLAKVQIIIRYQMRYSRQPLQLTLGLDLNQV